MIPPQGTQILERVAAACRVGHSESDDDEHRPRGLERMDLRDQPCRAITASGDLRRRRMTGSAPPRVIPAGEQQEAKRPSLEFGGAGVQSQVVQDQDLGDRLDGVCYPGRQTHQEISRVFADSGRRAVPRPDESPCSQADGDRDREHPAGREPRGLPLCVPEIGQGRRPCGVAARPHQRGGDARHAGEGQERPPSPSSPCLEGDQHHEDAGARHQGLARGIPEDRGAQDGGESHGRHRRQAGSRPARLTGHEETRRDHRREQGEVAGQTQHGGEFPQAPGQSGEQEGLEAKERYDVSIVRPDQVRPQRLTGPAAGEVHEVVQMEEIGPQRRAPEQSRGGTDQESPEDRERPADRVSPAFFPLLHQHLPMGSQLSLRNPADEPSGTCLAQDITCS